MARSRLLPARSPARLRALLGLLLVGLAAPAIVLVSLAFRQLELESFRQQQVLAEGLAAAIDQRLAAAVAVENGRGIDDYLFVSTSGVAPQRSPLAEFPPRSPVPGTVGYFEVAADGTLSTPFVPADPDGSMFAALDESERAARRALAETILTVLADNRLVSAAGRSESSGTAAPTGFAESEAESIRERAARRSPQAFRDAVPSADAGEPPSAQVPAPRVDDAVAAEEEAARQEAPAALASSTRTTDEVRGQAAFDRLNLGASTPSAGARSVAEEQAVSHALEEATVEAEPATAAGQEAGLDTGVRQASDNRSAAAPATVGSAEAPERDADGAAAKVSAFQSQREPLFFSRLDTGHFVLFRNAWRDAERVIQGLLIDEAALIDESIAQPFSASPLAGAARLEVASGAVTLAALALASDRPDGAPARSLYATRLSPPLADLELRFAVAELPRGPAFDLIVWTAVVLFSVLLGGVYAMYRFGLQQIDLAREQQNFVSAVSHELKTPLTSIRMYGEMLRSGWASDEKKQVYYDFIHAEGERLSRLIDNVLTFARLDRGRSDVVTAPATVAEIVDLVRSKVASIVERAGFALSIETDDRSGEASVRVDSDAIAQVFINLVDNAIKFGADAERKEIVISARVSGTGRIVFGVRDFGPGIAAADMKRLFELFYRAHNELTRSASGTGIGLALVRQLVVAMDGRVDVRNRDPGVEFTLSFPRAGSR